MRLMLCLLLLACGSSSSSSEREAPAPETTTPAPEPARPTPATPTCEPGWATPFTPDAAQLRRNTAALGRLRRGEIEEARVELTALLGEAPGYDSARFNLACALARLERIDQARAELETLLCRDLPTNLPRASSDEDLSALREHVSTIAARVLPQYRAVTTGTALVAFGNTEIGRDYDAPNLHWSQAGIWTGERFVPAGPRQQARRREGEEPLLASTIAGDVVIAVEGVSSASEGGYLPPFRVSVTKVFTGEEITTRRYDISEDEYYDISVGAVDGRAWIGFESHFRGAPPPRREWIDDRSRIGTEPTPSMQFGMQTWAPYVDETHVELMRRHELRLASTTITLDRRHRVHFSLRAIENDPWILLYSYASGDCGSPDRYFVQMIDRTSGRVLWEEAGEEQLILRFRDDALWLQKGNQLFRFADPARDERTPLPAGIGLSSSWFSFNPMC